MMIYNGKTLHVFYKNISARLIYLNFHPLEDVSRYRDPQLQVGENYSYLFNFRRNIKYANIDVKTLISIPISVI